jgi:hypothetical protein
MEEYKTFKIIFGILFISIGFIVLLLYKRGFDIEELNLKLYGVIQEKRKAINKGTPMITVNDSTYYFQRKSEFFDKYIFVGDSISKDSETYDIYIFRKDSTGTYQEVGIWKNE